MADTTIRPAAGRSAAVRASNPVHGRSRARGAGFDTRGVQGRAQSAPERSCRPAAPRPANPCTPLSRYLLRGVCRLFSLSV